MGLMDLIAHDVETYAKKALEVALNPDLRESLRSKILERSFALYDNPKPVAELRDFIHQQVGR
jgi:hypothetical protein